MNSPGLTVGQAAQHFGVAEWKIRRLYERRLLPPAARLGTYRVIGPDDLPRVEEALRQAGYLRDREAVAC